MENDNENSTVDSLLVHKATPEYLQDLLNDKKQLQHFPNIFLHVEIILEKEITRVRQKLFHINESTKKQDDELPEPDGTITTLQEKVFVPINENPNYNFVGRLLGPRGLTAKQLEQDLECKIMVRGRGSLRDKKKEDMNRGKPNWEHLDEDLHVLVSVEDYENRAAVKLRRATEKIRGFLEQGVRTPENEDRLKQLQLMELAVLNDKDRQQANVQQLQHQQQQQQLVLQHQSFTLLNNQVAAAAAAAAQMLQPSRTNQQQQQQQQQLQANQLLVRLSSQSPLVNPNIFPFSASVASLPCATAAGSGVPSLPGSALVNSTSTGTGASQSNSGTDGPSAYLRNAGLTSSALGQLAAGSTLSTSTVNNSQLGLNLSTLSQLQSTANPGFGFQSLGFPGLAAGLQNTISPNLINCSTGTNSDPLTAMAAALMNGTPVGTAQQLSQLTNGQVTANKSVPSIYPMTSIASPMIDAVNIFEYGNVSADQSSAGGDSLKMRTVSNSRMHPYLR